jgi:drug/metabolite transporter (DMT)-like permease
MEAVPGAASGAGPTRNPLTSRGRSSAAFSTRDWLLLSAVAVIFGASFFFIEIGLRAFAPALITLIRLVLGAMTLALFRRAREVAFSAEDAGRVALIGILWMGVPQMLFPIAQQWIDSSVAGMINSVMPLMTVAWTAVIARTFPARNQGFGLALGFLGILAISLPSLMLGSLDRSGTLFGILLAFVASSLYGLSATLMTPLQQRYGSMPVMLRAQLVGIVVVAPFGIAGLRSSHFELVSFLAMIPLGILGTAVAFIAMATLIGNVGAPRGSIAIYFVPIVSILLGVLVLGEIVHPLALVGTALVLLGAWLTSRREGGG